MDHPGMAVSAVMYSTGLVYLKGENPIYRVWTSEHGGGCPYLTEIDSPIYDAAWRQDNLDYLTCVLSVKYVLEKLEQAAQVLAPYPEADMAARVATDARQRTDIVEIRISDLLENLAKLQLDKDIWE